MWRQNRNPPPPSKDFDNTGLRIKLVTPYKYQGPINIPDAISLIHPSLITTPPESDNEDEAALLTARRPGFRFLPWEREKDNNFQDGPRSRPPLGIDDDLTKIMKKLLTYKAPSRSRRTERNVQSRAYEDDDCIEIIPENIKKEIPEVILTDDDEMPEIPIQPKVTQVIKQEIVPEVFRQETTVVAIKQEKLPEVANQKYTHAVVIKQEKPDKPAICEEPRKKIAENVNEAEALEFIKRCKLSAIVKMRPKESEKNKAESLNKKWSEQLIPYSDSGESAKRSSSEDNSISKISHQRRSGSSRNDEESRRRKKAHRRWHSSSDDSVCQGLSHRSKSSQRRKDHRRRSFNGERRSRSRRLSSDSDTQNSRYSKSYRKSNSDRRRSIDRDQSRSIDRYQIGRYTSRKRDSSDESSMRYSSRYAHHSRKKKDREHSEKVPKRYQLQKSSSRSKHSNRSSDSESSSGDSVSWHSKTSWQDKKGRCVKSTPLDFDQIILHPPVNSRGVPEELEDGEISDAESPACIKSPVQRNVSPGEGPYIRSPVYRNVSPGEGPYIRSPVYRNASPGEDRPHTRTPIQNVAPGEDRPHTRSPIHKNVAPGEGNSPVFKRNPYSRSPSPCSPIFKRSPYSRSPSPYQKLLHANSPGFQRSVSPANSYLSEEDRKPDIKQEFYDNNFYCDICQLSLNSMNTFDAHMKGKRHRKAVTAMQVQDLAKGGTPIDPVPLVKEVVTRRGKPPPGKKRLPLDIYSKMQELIDSEESPMPGLEYVLEIRAERDTSYFCELCEAPCAPITIRPHLKGFKHQLRCVREIDYNFYTRNKDRPKKNIEIPVRRLLIDHEKIFGRQRMRIYREIDDDGVPSYDQPGPSSRGLLSTDMFGSNVKPELPEMTEDELVTDVGFDGSYFDHNVYRSFTAGDIHCTLCDSHMNNTNMWEAHIQGKKHLKNHKKNPFDPRNKTKLIKSSNVHSKLLEELEYEKDNTDEASYVVGLDYIQETQNETGEMYNCRLCNGVCTNADIFTHLYSLKHKTKYLEILERDGQQIGISTIRSIEVGKESRESLINAECVKALERFGKGHPNVVLSVN